jgi:hypothetical protein
LTNSTVGVSGGLFLVALDFGANVFDGSPRWLEVGVRTNGSGMNYSTLSPRQALAAVPYAIRARSADTASTAQLANALPAGAVTQAMLASNSVTARHIADGAVGTTHLADGAVTARNVATVSDWFALTIGNPTPERSDAFGFSVAAVGAEHMIVGAEFSEAAYLFNASGVLLTTFTATESGGRFGHAVAGVGSDSVLIGAPSAGVAYLFRTNGTLLTTFAGVGSPLAAVGDNRVLFGVQGADIGATDAGAAYLYSVSGTLLTTFTNPTPATADFFGRSVAAVGNDLVLVGAPNDDTAGTDGGAAYLFNANGTLLTTFINPTPPGGDNFGWSVAGVGNDRVLIGAPGDNAPGATDAGVAYLFNINGTLLTTFTNPTPAASDLFGDAVAAMGSDRVLLGAVEDSTAAPRSGAAYLYRTDGTLLATFTQPIPQGSANFGKSLAAVGNRVLIGASSADTIANGAGAAYLFSQETYAPGVIADGVRPRSITRASLEDGAVTTGIIADGAVTAPKLAPGAATGTYEPVPGTIWFNPISRRFQGFDGVNWVPFTVGPPVAGSNQRLFTNSGSFVVPAGVTSVGIDVWGAGGGGGASGVGTVADDCVDAAGLGGGGGGGAGGYIRVVVNVTPNETLTVTAGASGAAASGTGLDGSAGGLSRVTRGPIELVSATGGGGGSAGGMAVFDPNPNGGSCPGLITGSPGIGGTADAPGTVQTIALFQGGNGSPGRGPWCYERCFVPHLFFCLQSELVFCPALRGAGAAGPQSPSPLSERNGDGGYGANAGVNNQTAGDVGRVRFFW